MKQILLYALKLSIIFNCKMKYELYYSIKKKTDELNHLKISRNQIF